MTCWPVSPQVGNVKNNDPSLIEPVAAESAARVVTEHDPPSSYSSPTVAWADG